MKYKHYACRNPCEKWKEDWGTCGKLKQKMKKELRFKIKSHGKRDENKNENFPWRQISEIERFGNLTVRMI